MDLKQDIWHKHLHIEPMSKTTTSCVYDAMEEYSNLRIIEVLGKITAVPDFGEGVNIYLDGLELSQRISELKSQLPLSTEDSNNDIPNSVGGGF